MENEKLSPKLFKNFQMPRFLESQPELKPKPKLSKHLACVTVLFSSRNVVSTSASAGHRRPSPPLSKRNICILQLYMVLLFLGIFFTILGFASILEYHNMVAKRQRFCMAFIAEKTESLSPGQMYLQDNRFMDCHMKLTSNPCHVFARRLNETLEDLVDDESASIICSARGRFVGLKRHLNLIETRFRVLYGSHFKCFTKIAHAELCGGGDVIHGNDGGSLIAVP
ncbi:hypothetical protein L596_018257 [Steinernema carpocapsae]|uniref:Uncharacterized protein n=1 Tax=Steinernema carpocapsae TaxID=34508 RepID=A0A4U5N4E6_STECR|nr:hypothetical protein L596_018257 [Steinernema carpocapsae]